MLAASKERPQANLARCRRVGSLVVGAYNEATSPLGHASLEDLSTLLGGVALPKAMGTISLDLGRLVRRHSLGHGVVPSLRRTVLPSGESAAFILLSPRPSTSATPTPARRPGRTAASPLADRVFTSRRDRPDLALSGLAVAALTHEQSQFSAPFGTCGKPCGTCGKRIPPECSTCGNRTFRRTSGGFSNFYTQ